MFYRAGAAGGGASANGSVTNCTFAGNSAIGGQTGIGLPGDGAGGGIAGQSFQTVLTNTIVANNTSSTSGANGIGKIVDGGHNICSDASCGFTTATSLNNTDPRLGRLVYTGGSVPTLPLLAGSPAIDAGDDSQALATDARGAARQGAHSDIGAYERPVWQAEAVAVDTNNDTILLWNHNQGYVSLWNVSSTGTPNGQWLYGPYAGWTCLDMAVGADNKARLLWRYTDGRLAIWGVDATTGAVLYQRGIAAVDGWTALALRVGSDNNARLLWRYVDGRVCVWTLEESSGSRLSQPVFTPGSGYTYADFALASNNNLSILCNHSDGTQNISTIDGNGNLVTSFSYGPYAGWTATRLSVGADGQTRLLWNHVQGYTTLWNINTITGILNTQTQFGPYQGWNASTLTAGSDNNARLLWNHINGYNSLWNVDSACNILNQFLYGPY